MKLRGRWSGSILLRVATVLGAVTVLAVAVVLTAAVFTKQSTGKGAAINVAGSLRMQSYLLATRVVDQRGEPAQRQAAVVDAVAGFERRLMDQRLLQALPADGDLRRQHDGIALAWGRLKPLALAAHRTPAEHDAFLDRVHPLVAQIDAFVGAVEDNLESRIQGLQVALGSALLVIFALGATACFVLHRQVFRPIKQLVRLTQAVRRGEFGARAAVTGADELGQLGRDFNHMVEELGRLYGSLEAQIAAKTADLAEKNKSLSLLYETARELSSATLGQDRLRRVAARAREVLGVQDAVICLCPAGVATGLPLATAEVRGGAMCGPVQCTGCLHRAGAAWPDPADACGTAAAGRVVSVPILDGARVFGVMSLQLAPGQQLVPWQMELAQTVARHLGAAVSAAEARDEHRRLALLEERSAIARELHDSLAQSLSYTKIQLTRLSALLNADGAPAPARAVVQELREGVSTAYRQLRELLTTFRLKLNGKGLSSAVQEAVQDLAARSGVATALHNELSGVELSANAQVHVLQIVREALSNIEHHAHAQQATVRLHRRDTGAMAGIEVVVEDDGVGIAVAQSPRHHFGLSIMSDRARMLGGSVEVAQRDPGSARPGTRVRLTFPALNDAPLGPAAAPPAMLAQQA